MNRKLFATALAAMTLLLTGCNMGKGQDGSAQDNDSTAVQDGKTAQEPDYDLEAIAKTLKEVNARTAFGFVQGRASIINQDDKLGVIDKHGRIIIPFELEYDYSVFEYTDSILCCHRLKDDVRDYYDLDGNLLFSTKDGGNDQFHDGYACKYSDDTDDYYYIDKTGKPAFGGKHWAWAEPFSDGMALVAQKGLWGFINTRGELVIPCQYTSLPEQNPESFHEGAALVVINPATERQSFIDKTGKRLFDAEFSTAFSFREGLASVYDDLQDRWAYIDKTGKTVITLDQGVAGRDFSEGLAMIHHWGSPIGYIDKTGELVFKFEENQYTDAWPFHEGRARVWDGNKEGFIDRTGKLVIPCEYTVSENFSEGLVAVWKNDQPGYIDLNGKSTYDYNK